MTRVTIDSMKLELEVSTDDRAAFARLFREHFEPAMRAERDREGARRRNARDRSVDGRGPGEDGR